MLKKILSTTNPYKIIKNERHCGKLSHAYLIFFNDGMFLREALNFFSAVILGKEADRQCQLIEKEVYADCNIYPQQNEKWSVSVVKKILEDVIIKPTECENKLFVFDRAEEMSIPVQNKLLKVLEEPPKNVCFLIGATNGYNLLPTFLSRVKKLTILPFTDKQVLDYLKVECPYEDDVEDIANSSNGSIGKAIKLLGTNYKQLENTAFNLAMSFQGSQIVEAVKGVGEGVNGVELLNLLRIIFADSLFIKLGNENIHLKSRKKQLEQIANFLDTGALLFASSEISNAEKNLNFNSALPTLLEKLLVGVMEENKKWKKL